MERKVKIMKVPRDGVKDVMPKKATPGSAGWDLFAAVPEPVVIGPGSFAAIPTGVAVALPDSGFAAFLFARSGLAVKHGVTLSNGVGVVDSDYRGEIVVGLCNLSEKAYTIEPGERIAQMIVMPVPVVSFEEVGRLEPTRRAAGGFGSTGRR